MAHIVCSRLARLRLHSKTRRAVEERLVNVAEVCAPEEESEFGEEFTVRVSI